MRRTLPPAAALLLLLAICASQVAADTLVLKDGTTVEGQVSKTGARYGVITDAGIQWFDQDQVERVELDPLKTVDADTRAAYLAVKAEAARQEAPAEAIALWEKYIADHPAGPLLETARGEILAWQKALALGLVPWAGKRVRPEERDLAQRKAVELIDTGLRQVTDGKFAEARKTLDQAARLWPNHPTVDFYSAEVLRNSRQPLDAAKRLVNVLQEMPEHLPSLNNLACLCSQLTDYRSAVVFLARALRKAPYHETVVDNAWEVLHLIDSVKQGNIPRPDLLKISKDDLAVLTEACAAQESRMARQDRYRWGSTWIARTQLEDHLAARKAVEQKIAEMQKEMERLNAQIADVDLRIEAANRTRDANMQAGSGSGVIVIQRQIRELQAERAPLVDAKARLQAQARDLVKNRPEPQWSSKTTMLPIESPLAKIADGPEPEQAIRNAILSGQAVLTGGDGQPLGRASVEPHHPRSIWNALGRHGSPWSKLSVFDPTSPYGRDISALSCRDPAATTPPQLVLSGQKICYLTANPALSPRITLESLVTVLRKQK